MCQLPKICFVNRDAGLRRYKTAYDMFNLVVKTMFQSFEALCVMVGFILLAMVFYGSIIFMLESGEFEVTEDYPEGAVTIHRANQTPSHLISNDSSFLYIFLYLYRLTLSLRSIFSFVA